MTYFLYDFELKRRRKSLSGPLALTNAAEEPPKVTAPAALPAPTLPDLSMALVPIGGQLAKAIDSDFRVRLNPFYSITFTIFNHI